MRAALLALLFINLILFAWGQDLFGNRNAARESERLARQIDPEKLRILPLPVANAPEAATSVETPGACKRIAGLAPAEAAEVHTMLLGVPGWQAELKARKDGPQYRVTIPELASQAIAQKKQGELRKLGVDEGAIIEDTALGGYALLLKTFASGKAAEDYLQTIARKGVRSARIVPREATEKVAIEVRAPAADLLRKLPELLAPLQPVDLTDCPAS